MPSTKKDVDMDAIMAEVGHFGCYQLRLFLLVIFPVIFCAAAHSQYIFNTASLNHRCFVPECEERPGKWKPGAWAEWALIPGSKCTRRKPISGKCEQAAFSDSRQKCDLFVYESNDTVVAEFNLACKDVKRVLVGSIHSIGVFVAYTFIGIVSDTIGRRTTFICAVTGAATMGIIRSFANSYTYYITFEFLDAVFGGGIYGTGFVLVIEMVGKHQRVLCGSTLSSIFAVGLIILAAEAWAFPYWRTLTRVIYAPAFMVLTYFFCLSESIRWLISKDNHDKVIHVLQKIAAMNGKHLSIQTINDLKTYMTPEQNTVDNKPEAKKPVWRQVCHSRILMTRVLICSFCWITTTLVYYGISINSVSLSGNKYANFMVTALFEIPGCFLSNMFLDRFGRKRTLMMGYLTCSTLLFLMPFIPKKYNLYPTLFAKSFISLSFVSIYIFTLELFPTSARHSLMALCSLVGRIGSMTAPQTPLLIQIKYWLPYVLFGSLACIAAVLLTYVPETLRRPMPDTIEQAEDLLNTPETPDEVKTVKKPDSGSTSAAGTSSAESSSAPTTSAVAKSSTKS